MASEIRNRFTDTEMQIARETDLPELLSHLGYQVKRVGRFHTTAEMDSLRIKDRRTWFRYSQNTGGDAITFLQQFCGKSFPEAVEYLLTFHGKARDAPAPEPKPISPKQALSLPPRNADDRRVFAYLRKRGIAAQVIRQFLNAGLLYEDAVHHNCVFVGRDESGQAKYAGLRGTYDLDSPGFKGDAPGSDKNTAFSLPHDPRSDLVLVFEAPIDLMSYLTLHRDMVNAVALCGLYLCTDCGKIEKRDYGDGSFRADDEINRAEVVTIVNRPLGREADEAYVANNLRKLNTFSDINKRHCAYYAVMEAANAHTAILGDSESWSK